MNRMKYVYMTVLLSGMTFVSCDDFLTEMPKHKLVIENAVIDYASAKNIVNGMYGVYEANGNLGGTIPGLLYSQGGMWNYNTTFVSMGYKQSTPDTYTPTIWKSLYSCINAANAAISGINLASSSIFPSETAKNDLIAEARCFRGFMHMQLLLYYAHWFDKADSPYGIIYRDELANLSNLMIPRSTVGESYQYIIDDLEYAEKNLRDYETSKYVSKQFAQAMHAKLLLIRGWEGDYAASLKLVEEVLSKAPAAFKMESNITDLYEKTWDSNEVLFSRCLADLVANGGGAAGNNDYIYAGALYQSNDQFTDVVDQWVKGDTRYPYISGPADGPEKWQVDAGMVRENVLTKLYHRGKVKGPDDKYCTYVFRYAELFLMKAELLARTNPTDIAGALKPLNDMRAKYTTPEMNPISTPANYNDLIDVIFKEYVVTLFMENDTPWFASIRLQKEGDTWLKYLKGNDVSYSSNQYCWPIPEEEIIAHTNKIDQNPGLE